MEAAEEQPHFAVEEVVIETGFAVESAEGADVTIAIVGGGGTRTVNSGNRVVLTLSPPESGPC